MPRELGSGTGPVHYTAWKVSKYGVFSGQYFPAFSPNAGKCGPEKTPNLDTFHAVRRCNFALMKLLAWLTNLVLRGNKYVFVESRWIGITFLQKHSRSTDKDQYTYCSLTLFGILSLSWYILFLWWLFYGFTLHCEFSYFFSLSIP